jgi:hypothetical protein
MPRFVLLEHDHPTLHYDFMIEWGSVLRTWRLGGIPSEAASIPAEPLPDHRTAYLDYEGPVSGDRGTVSRIDRGEFEILAESRTSLELSLQGERIIGKAILSDWTREEGDPAWEFYWSPETAIC